MQDQAMSEQLIEDISGVRTQGDPDGASLWEIDGRLVIRVFTQCGHDCTGIDLEDLTRFLAERAVGDLKAKP